MPLLVLLFPFQVAAAAPTATVTIDDAVGAAIANHPDVVVAGAQTDIADAQARQSRASLLPADRRHRALRLLVERPRPATR